MALEPSQARVVGVDVGTKRVGLALADPLQMFSQTHGTFDPEESLEELVRIDRQFGIEAVVVGWPLTEEGEEGEATEFVQSYIERLRERLDGISIERQDERFTSEMAKDALRRAGVRQPGRRDKGRVDAAAAALILQSYLDSRS